MIKRFFFLFSFIGVLVGGINSQSQFKPEWNFGVGFGPTFSSMSFEQPKVKTQSFTQYHGGIAVRYLSEKNLGVIGELNYSQQGWEGKFMDHPDYSHSHTLTYIELPVLTHIYFGNKVRFFINLGPKIQFLLGEKEELSDALANAVANGEAEVNTPQYNRDVERKFDYGIMGGMGLELRTKIGNFSLEGRYCFGLGDIYDNRRRDNNFGRSANRVMSAKLTYYVKIF